MHAELHRKKRESALSNDQASAAGAVGPWQFTKITAKAYGLRVDGQVDERKDLVKSTVASCKYLRDLILDFGAGSSRVRDTSAVTVKYRPICSILVFSVSDLESNRLAGI